MRGPARPSIGRRVDDRAYPALRGPPYAALEDDLEQTLALVRRVRAQQAVSQLCEAAARSGAAASDEEIEAEVRGVRRDRKRA